LPKCLRKRPVLMNPLVKLLRKFLQSQLISGGAIVFAGSALASFANYLYHLVMFRFLGPADYGILESLISLLYLSGIPMGTLSLVIVKYVAQYKAEKRMGAVGKFFWKLNRKLLPLGFLGFFIFLAATPLFKYFLHLKSGVPLLFVGLIGLVGVFGGINGSFLRGLLKFGVMSLSGVLETIFKLALAILLVVAGMGVSGAIGSTFIAGVLGYFLSLYFLKEQICRPNWGERLGREKMVSYTWPVFFSLLAFTSLYTSDIILARHFLAAESAGFYAALATLGKIIVFASGPIITVMFPLASESYTKGRNYQRLLTLSFVLVLLVCLGIGGIYFLFPRLMIKLLFGSQALPVAPYLYLFAIFLGLYSLSSLLVNFYLSIGRTRVVVLPVLAALFQIILIFIGHGNIPRIALNSILALSLLFLSLLGYHFWGNAEKKKALAFRHRSRL